MEFRNKLQLHYVMRSLFGTACGPPVSEWFAIISVISRYNTSKEKIKKILINEGFIVLKATKTHITVTNIRMISSDLTYTNHNDNKKRLVSKFISLI